MASERFNALLRETGGAVSESKDTLSRHAGCLVERLCVVESNRLKWYDSVSVGSLTGSSRVFREKGDESLPSFARGPALSRAPGVPWMASVIFAGDYRNLRSRGFNPHLPREFGGPGFPGTDAEVRRSIATLRPHWVRALRVAASQGVKAGVTLSSLQAIWRNHSTVRSDEIRQMVATAIAEWEGERRRQGEAGEGTIARCSLQELERAVLARFQTGDDLFRGFPKEASWRLTLDSVERGLGRVLTSVNVLVPYPRLTGKVRNLSKGLLKFLERVRSEEYLLVPPRLRTYPAIGAAIIVEAQ